MAFNRSFGRTVHVYNAIDRAAANREVLGGLILNKGVTKASFHSMVETFLLFHSFFSIETEDAATLQRNEEPLVAGNYYVVGRLGALFLT